MKTCLFSLVIVFHILIGLARASEFAGVVSTSVNYTGGIMPCASTNCSGMTTYFSYYACNNGSVNWEGTTQSFWDPVPEGYQPVQINVTLYGSYGCVTLQANAIAVTIDAVIVQFLGATTPSLGSCNCSNCALTSTLQSTIYSDGWPNYIYGGENNIGIISLLGVYVCMSSAVIDIGYNYKIPSVSVYRPTMSPVGEQTQVEIYGSNFANDTVYCSFGEMLVPAVFVSDTHISCMAPVLSQPQVVYLEVVGNTTQGQIQVPAGNYSWYNEPVPTSFSPQNGSTAGQSVYIYGTGFFNSSSIGCRFGSLPLLGTYIDSTRVLCPDVESSGGKTGPVNVSVSQNMENWVEVPGQYLFLSSAPTNTPTNTPTISASFTPSPSMSVTPAADDSLPQIPGYVWAAFGIIFLLVMILCVGLFLMVVRNRQDRHASARNAEAIPISGYSEEYADSTATKLLGADPSTIPFQELRNMVQIEKGSFGVIYEASWRGTKIAVKKLPANISEKLMTEFLQEAHLMRTLRHPNILQYLGLSYSGRDVCICMEFMELGSLYRILHMDNSSFSRARIRGICLDTARGMTYLHQQNPPIIHRDLKSHNLLVDRHWQVKVCDFGLSRITAQNQTMTACGTPSWTAPEVLRNERYTTKADVYGFGIVIWEMFARSDPFPGMPPFQIVFAVGTQHLRPRIDPAWPATWVNLMTTCWNEDPETRPTFEELITMLEAMEPLE